MVDWFIYFFGQDISNTEFYILSLPIIRMMESQGIWLEFLFDISCDALISDQACRLGHALCERNH